MTAARDAPKRKYPTDCTVERGVIFSPLGDNTGGAAPNCDDGGTDEGGGVTGGADTFCVGAVSVASGGVAGIVVGGLAPSGGVGATKDTPPVPAGAAAWLGPVSASSTRLLLSN